MILALVAAGCGGSGETASVPSTPAPTTSSGQQADKGSQEGRQVFVANCSTCHTLAAAGANGMAGPNLDQLRPDEATVKAQVTNGGGGMPAFAGTLDPGQIDAVATYVSSVAGR